MSTIKIKLTDKCPVCDGHGHIEVFCTDDLTDKVTEVCTECFGVGILTPSVHTPAQITVH